MAAKKETKTAEQIISAAENAEIFNIVIAVKLVLSNAPQSGKVSLLKLGLTGIVFPVSEGVVYFHNPLLRMSLRSFDEPANWVCFA